MVSCLTAASSQPVHTLNSHSLHLTLHSEQNRHTYMCVLLSQPSHAHAQAVAHSSSGHHQPLATASTPVTPTPPRPYLHTSPSCAHIVTHGAAHITTSSHSLLAVEHGGGAALALQRSPQLGLLLFLPRNQLGGRPRTDKGEANVLPWVCARAEEGGKGTWCERQGVRLRGEGRARAVRSAARRVPRQRHSRRILGSLRTTLLYTWIPTPAVAPDIIVRIPMHLEAGPREDKRSAL